MVMSDGQDLDVFIKEIYQLRDDLVEMGEVINDDSLLDIDSEGLTDDIFRSSTTPKMVTVLRWIKLYTRCVICMLIIWQNTDLRESRRGVNRPW